MASKRPCRVCLKWFLPDVRAGDRQRVCSSADCQRERHRRACLAWHAREQPAVRAARLAQQLTAPVETPQTAQATEHQGQSSRQPAGVIGGLRLDALRDAVGWQATVAIELFSKHLSVVLRDAVRVELAVQQGNSLRHLRSKARDGIAAGPRPP